MSRIRTSVSRYVRLASSCWISCVALKIASTGWRMLRYYRGGEEYVRRGQPHVALRVLIAPVIATVTLPEADRLQDQATARIGLDAR